MTKTTENPPKSRGGRPRFEATPERKRQVETLAGYGLTREQIADFIGCSHDTVQTRFKEELRVGTVRALAKVGQSLFQAATGWMQVGADGRITGAPDKSSVTAAIWFEKTRGGRSDRVMVDASVKGKTEVAAQVHVTSDAADREAAGLVAILESLLPGSAGRAGLVAEDGPAEATPPKR